MNIVVVAQPNSHIVTPETIETINFAKQMTSSEDCRIELWIIGGQCQSCLESFRVLPIDEVVIAENAVLKRYVPEHFLDALEALYLNRKPDVITFAGDYSGSELSVRLAARLKTKVKLNCIGIHIHQNKIILNRPVFNGNLHASYSVNKMPLIFSTQNQRSQKSINTNTNKLCKVTIFDFESKTSTKWLVSVSLEPRLRDDLVEADFVIIGGRGVGSRQNFEWLKGIAAKMNAVVGGTRPVINNGWLPVEGLVGQSGKKIAPNLCIVVGASGATPLVTGIENARHIVAINSDPNAPIFRVCHWGIVGDYKEIFQQLFLMRWMYK